METGKLFLKGVENRKYKKDITKNKYYGKHSCGKPERDPLLPKFGSDGGYMKHLSPLQRGPNISISISITEFRCRRLSWSMPISFLPDFLPFIIVNLVQTLPMGKH